MLANDETTLRSVSSSCNETLTRSPGFAFAPACNSFPTIIECVGAPPHPDDYDLPGASLFDLARGTALRRTILSEYHAAGAATGAFMIRKGPFKYVYYAGMPPQLFDLDTDPQETRDLAREAGYQGLVADCDAALRRVVDPDAAAALAKTDQRARIAAMGGRRYWDDGRDVYDIIMGLLDYPETERHGAFTLSLVTDFEDGGGGTTSFRFVGTEGVCIRGSDLASWTGWHLPQRIGNRAGPRCSLCLQ